MSKGHWRTALVRYRGDGTNALLTPDAPLSGVTCKDMLSGHGEYAAKIAPALASAVVDGRPVIEPWATGIVTMRDDVIMGVHLASEISYIRDELQVKGVGLTGYAAGHPYRDNNPTIGTRAGYLIAHLWAHLQAYPGANLGLVVPRTPTSTILGSRTEPLPLTPWDVKDIGAKVDQIATSGHVDYELIHAWGTHGMTSRMHMDDTLGRRRTDIRLVAEENLAEEPRFTGQDTPVATDVVCYGSGEGAAQVRGYAPHQDTGRLARWRIVEQQTITSAAEAVSTATSTQAAMSRALSITEVKVRDSPAAPHGSIQLGDSIYLQGARVGFTQRASLWVRVLARSWAPETDVLTLTVTKDG